MLAMGQGKDEPVHQSPILKVLPLRLVEVGLVEVPGLGLGVRAGLLERDATRSTENRAAGQPESIECRADFVLLHTFSQGSAK